MKILLDENLPHALRTQLTGHQVFTVGYMNWCGLENGELLSVAAAQGFDVLITRDKGVEYEQNQSTLPTAVVLLRGKVNTAEDVVALAPAILHALSNLKPKSLTRVHDGA